MMFNALLSSDFQSSSHSPQSQTGFRPGRSTETTVLLVLAENPPYVVGGDFVALFVRVYWQSSKFDTVDHEILVPCLRTASVLKVSF